MLSWLRSLFAPAPVAKPAPISNADNRAQLRARYDNAQSNNDQRDLWGLADVLSANSANNFSVRRTLRMRSRYEYANSPYLQGVVNTKVNKLIGRGPTLQIETGNEAANEQIEKAFAKWAKAVDLVGKLRTMARAKIVDGEGFLFLTTYKRLDDSVQLYPRDIEADQVMTPDIGFDNRNWVDGVVLDELGNPLAYNLLDQHPGDLFITTFSPLKYKQIRARFVLHWFRKDRPGQVRGIPETASALDLWGETRRYRKAVVAAAETVANNALVITTEAPANPEDDQLISQGSSEPFSAMEIPRGTATVLPWGANINQPHAEQPSTTFDVFSEKMLGESCRPIGVPLNQALGTSQKFNFSSARLDHMDSQDGIDIERDECETVALDKIFAAWFDEAIMVPGLIPDGITVETVTATWHWQGFRYLDPLTDAKADTEQLQVNGTLTLKEFYNRRGQDWKEQLEQLAAEFKLRESLGLPQSGTTKITVNEDATPPGDTGDSGDAPPSKPTPKKGAKSGQGSAKEPATAA